MSGHRSPESGYVLVNALVLVAALSAVAVFLLARADAGRNRLDAGLTAAQVSLNLDAYEALAKTLLERDTGAVDHSGENWAKPVIDMPLERGRVTGRVVDQQGLFNLNWLSNPDYETAHRAFDRLLTQQGVPQRVGQQIQALLSADGPTDPAAWHRKTPAEAPVSGPMLMADQLAHVPGVSERHLSRLQPFVTALPGDSTLNVNTVSEEVLRAFLPNLSAAAYNQVFRDRTAQPFSSVDAFLAAVGVSIADADNPEGPPPLLLPEHFSVGSQWFRAEISASINGHFAQRNVVFQRQSFPVGVTTHWRITTRP
ncbi:type II secretion system minor pseudopilin GspK [uncultured Shimia sp.]|uniref:type II secretion system minor pseudopilin GspK n=1 Tax=uncultured Shimia sp. TaxID=573152 RepID=UPI0025E0B6CA|nr:type II secretion system minor pseudopilin GspK [uncultured Shimia sp.]